MTHSELIGAKTKFCPSGNTSGPAVGLLAKVIMSRKGCKRYRGVVIPPSIPANEPPQKRGFIYL